jgi:hypothetical protein
MGIRARVKEGYSFIGRGKIAYPGGTVFEDIDEEVVQDQMWKLELLPSKKADEPLGVVDTPAKKIAEVEEEVEEEVEDDKTEEVENATGGDAPNKGEGNEEDEAPADEEKEAEVEEAKEAVEEDIAEEKEEVPVVEEKTEVAQPRKPNGKGKGKGKSSGRAKRSK